MERVRPELGTSRVSYRALNKIDKNLRVIDSHKEAYRIDGEWVRLPREIMDALEDEGVYNRYIKTKEYFTDRALLEDTEVDVLVYEV